jgi:hypothetical protein
MESISNLSKNKACLKQVARTVEQLCENNEEFVKKKVFGTVNKVAKTDKIGL